jgi:hypothetical protein
MELDPRQHASTWGAAELMVRRRQGHEDRRRQEEFGWHSRCRVDAKVREAAQRLAKTGRDRRGGMPLPMHAIRASHLVAHLAAEG